MVVHARRTDRFFTFEVSHTGKADVSVCGKTLRPIEIEPGSSLEFDIGLNRWGSTTDCPAHRCKTTGTIRVTLPTLR